MLLDNQEWAKDRVAYWWTKANQVFNSSISCNHQSADSISPPKLRFSTRMRARAGCAIVSKREIILSTHFLNSVARDDFDQTIGHEVMHIFVDIHYDDRCNHDRTWKHAMVRVGLEPKRCHQYL